MLNAFCRHKDTMHLFVTVLYLLIATISAADDTAQRWSRQISNAEFLNDWIPVQPRQTSGRVLNFGPPFSHPQSSIDAPLFLRNQPQELPSVNHVGELQQQLYFHQMPAPNAPLMTVQNGPVQHHPQQQHFLFRPQQPDIPNLNYQFTQQFAPPPAPQLPQQNQKPPTFIANGIDLVQHQQPQSQPLVHHNDPANVKNNVLHQNVQAPQPQPQEEVQLLYVPLDTLYQQQSDKLQNTRYNVLPSPVNPAQINNNLFSSQQQLQQQPIYPSTTPSPPPRLTTRTTPRHRPNTPSTYHRFSTPVTEVIDTTTRPKPHQPPLAMFMKKSAHGPTSKLSVNDVLSKLVSAQSIDVLDSAGKSSPQIFVGPSGLKTPDGYSKFDLPYLSSIEQTRNERQIETLPFFVAPLSYRTPNGFAKIPLPSPHVGSVVVNAYMNSINNDDNDRNRNYPEKTFYTPQPKKQPQHQYLTEPPASSNGDRFIKPTTMNRFRFGTEYFSRTTPQTPAHRPEAAAIISSTPSYNLDAYNVFRTTPLLRRPSTETPAETTNEQKSQFTHSTFAPFSTYSKEQPTYDNFAKVRGQQANAYATDAPATVATVYDDTAFRNTFGGPSKYILSNSPNLVNNTHLHVPHHTPAAETYTQYYTPSTPRDSYYSTPEPNVATTKKSVYDFGFDRYQSNKVTSQTSAPISSTTTSTTNTNASPSSDDLLRIKSHYREREQQQLVSNAPTSHPSYAENASIQPTQNEQEYSNEPYSTVPTQLTNYNRENVLYNRNQNNHNANLPSSTPKTTFTYYTASAAQDENENLRTREPYVHQFRFVDSVVSDFQKQSDVNKNDAPAAHQGTFNRQNEFSKLSYNDVSSTPASQPTRVFDSSSTPTPTSPSSPTHSYREYQVTPATSVEQSSLFDLFTESPQIKSNLPGLVNSLMDGGANNGTPDPSTTTPATVQITTRRSTLGRGRRPQLPARLSTYATEAPTPRTTTRRVINRGRRPVASTAVEQNRTSTIRTSAPLERNTNRVRYNPTAEDRQRNRSRLRVSSTARPSRKDEQNIDYQRDVLKQNYPNFGKTDAIPSSTAATISTFDDSSANKLKTNEERERQQEPQQLSESDVENPASDDVIEPTYFNSRESFKLNAKSEAAEITTESSSFVADNNQSEISKVLRTRKPTVIRRPLRTSTPRPITTTAATEVVRSKVRNTTRPKSWYESNTRASAKPLYRERRPFASQRTTSPPPTEPDNHKFTNDDDSERDNSGDNVPAQRNPTEKKKNQFRFSLSAEESQWSSNLNSNSFQPVDPSSAEKQQMPQSDIEIVTASSASEADNKETYLFNVESKNVFGATKNSETANNAPASTPSATLNDIIPATVPEAVANDNNNQPDKQIGESNATQEETKRPSLGKDAKGKRRGVWKRVRVRPVDSFEAAESQNIGKQLYNSLLNDNAEEFGMRYNKRVKDFAEKSVVYAEQPQTAYEDDTVNEVPTTYPTFITPENDDDQTSVATESTIDDEIATTLFDSTEATTFAPDTTTISTSAWNIDDEKDNVSELTTELIEKNTIIPIEVSTKTDENDVEHEPTIESFTASPSDTSNYTNDADSERTKDDDSDNASEPDQEPQSSSVIDEVKKRLTELFSFEDDDVMVSTTERVFRINRNFNRPKSSIPSYTTIDRTHAVNEIMNERNKDLEKENKLIASPATMKLEPVTVLKTILRPVTEASSSFHKDLMDSVIYATSTSTEISHETEICYRGRCVKTHKKP